MVIVLVHKYGNKRWKGLAVDFNKRMGNTLKRSGKMCRERWISNLDLSNRKGQWTEVEEDIFLKGHAIFGNRWANIAKFIPGRQDGFLKNHFYSTMRVIMGKIKSFEFSTSQLNSQKRRENLIYYLNYMKDAVSFFEHHEQGLEGEEGKRI